MSNAPRGVGRFLASLVAFVGIAVGVPGLLVAASRVRFGSANPLAGATPPWQWFGGSAGLGEEVGDDAFLDAVIRVCLCVAWVATAVIVVTTVVEVAHVVRHRGLPRPGVRGLGWAQPLARFIAVGLLAVLPMLASTPAVAAPSGPRAGGSWLPDRPVVAVVVADAEPTADGAGAPAGAPGAVSTHVVERGESVYSIAASIAAVTGRPVIEVADEIVELNLGASMGVGARFTNPAYIEVGWVLQVPTTPGPIAERLPVGEPVATYVVRTGDTLWDIAGSVLGDPASWVRIWDANAGRDMGGGRTFDDPDLILPGWELVVPARSGPAGTGPTEPTVAPPSPPPAESGPGGTGPTEPIADDGPIIDLDAPILVDDAPVTPADPAPADPVVGEPVVTPTPTTTTTTTTTVAPQVAGPGGAGGDVAPPPAPDAPSPIRIEHAALLAAGILALVGVRRRQRLRSARPRHRVPEPRPEVIETERRLRAIDAGERAMRVDVACRAAAAELVATAAQIGSVIVSADGDVELRLTAPSGLDAPWAGEGQSWRLGAEVPVELLSDRARQVGLPCVALVQIGVTPTGDDVLVDLEACGTLAIEASGRQGDEVVAAMAAGLASSPYAEIAHLVGVSLPEAALLGHRNAHLVDSVDAAFDVAASVVGTTAGNEQTTFALRSLHTGGEMWEPAIVLLTSTDAGELATERPSPPVGHGIAVVVATDARSEAPCRVRAETTGWLLEAFGTTVELTPVGLTRDDLTAIDDVLADAARPLEPVDTELATADAISWADADPVGADMASVDDDGENSGEDEFVEPAHEIVVGLLGGVEVTDRAGHRGQFERSKTVELIAWLACHRERPTRTGARTALWELDVRDATFANVVSEARRALARLVPPPDGDEWVARTLSEQLPIHDAVVTDAALVEARLEHARLQPPAQALATLRPAVELVRNVPFAGTSYLWPDAEGITSNLVLLAISVTTEYAGHALSLGDTEGVFWATGRGLQVIPGHEELIGLRMRAHARSGDLAGVRHEWETYERVLVADAWSDGEPAPKLVALRHELLSSS